MAIELPVDRSNSIASSYDHWTSLLDILRVIALCWLLLVGLWSGPAYGATLVYPNGIMYAEGALAVILLLSALRGRVRAPAEYPFLWPCLGVMALCGLAGALRIAVRGTHAGDETLLLWRHGEPMLRGLLLYLAVAGQAKFVRAAWAAALAGLLLHSGAAIVQHFTHITRWYANLDRGWADGWKPVLDPMLHKAAHHHKARVYSPLRVQGLTSYINLTAAMLAAAIPFFAIPAVLVGNRIAWKRSLLAAGGFATGAALWYTDSRGPICAVIVVFLLLALLFSGRWRASLLTAIAVFTIALIKHSEVMALVILLLAAGLLVARRWWRNEYVLPVILALTFAGSVQLVDAYLLHYPLSLRVSDNGLLDRARIVLYRAALTTTASSPYWGVGDAGVAFRVLHLPKRYELFILPKTQQNFHDQYLQWAASEGVFVALAFTLLVCWAVYWCWRLYQTSTDPPARALGLAAAAGLTIFLLCNLVDAQFWRIEGGGFFWSLLAVTAATGTTGAGSREGGKRGQGEEAI